MSDIPLTAQELSDRLRPRRGVNGPAIPAPPSEAAALLRASSRRVWTEIFDAVEPDQDALKTRRERERAERKRLQREQGDAYQPRRKKSRGDDSADPIDLTSGPNAAPHRARRALNRAASSSDARSDSAASARSRSRSTGATSSDSSAAAIRRSGRAIPTPIKGGAAAGSSAGRPPFLTPALEAAIDEARRQIADAYAAHAASADADAAPAAAAAAAAPAPDKQYAVHSRRRPRSEAQSREPLTIAAEHLPAARLSLFMAMAWGGERAVKDDTTIARLAYARLAFFKAKHAGSATHGNDADDESDDASAAPVRRSARRIAADERGRAAVAAAKGSAALSSVSAQSRAQLGRGRASTAHASVKGAAGPRVAPLSAPVRRDLSSAAPGASPPPRDGDNEVVDLTLSSDLSAPGSPARALPPRAPLSPLVALQLAYASSPSASPPDATVAAAAAAQQQDAPVPIDVDSDSPAPVVSEAVAPSPPLSPAQSASPAATADDAESPLQLVLSPAARSPPLAASEQRAVSVRVVAPPSPLALGAAAAAGKETAAAASI